MTEQDKEKKHVFCPYCDEEIRNLDLPWCQACKVEVFCCPACHQPVDRDKKVCPLCGAEIADREE